MASKLIHFVSLTDWFIMLGAKLLNSILIYQPTTALRARFFIGTFEKRAPEQGSRRCFADVNNRG